MSGWRGQARERSRESYRQYRHSGEREREREYDRGHSGGDEQRTDRYRNDWERSQARGQQQPRHSNHPYSGPARPRRGSGSSFHQEDSVPEHRREPVSGANQTPFNETARRSSVSSVASKTQDPSHASPRERGMIEQSGQKRKISPSWDRDREAMKVRGDPDRRSSYERPEPPSPHDVPMHSPSTTTPKTPMMPSGNPRPADPRLASGNAQRKPNSFASVFQEAAFAFMKREDARETYNKAEADRNRVADYFNAFPVMRDRYEGRLEEARRELTQADVALKIKSKPLETICIEFARENCAKKELEPMVSFVRQLRNELGGSSSLAQFIKSAQSPSANLSQSQQPAAKHDEFLRFDRELADLRKRRDEEEKFRGELFDSFHKYKGDTNKRLKTYDDRLKEVEVSQRGLRNELKQTGGELRRVVEDIKRVQQSLAQVQESTTGKIQNDVIMADAANSGSDVAEIKKIEEGNVLPLVDRYETLQEKYQELEPRVKELELKIDNVGVGSVSSDDIARLEQQLKIQDETIDSIRQSAGAETEIMMEQFAAIDAGIQENQYQTSQLTAGLEECKALVRNEMGQDKNATEVQAIQATLGEYRTNINALKVEFQNFIAMQHDYASKLHALDKHSSTITPKLSKEIETVQTNLAKWENNLDGCLTAVTHLDQKMNSFTTKDFYERVVQSLIAINPSLFNTTNQLQHMINENKKYAATVQKLLVEHQQNQANEAIQQQQHQSLQGAPNSSSTHDEAANGTANPKEAVPSEGPGSLSQALKDIESHTQAIEALTRRVDQHIETYSGKMSDIREWTISATQRIQENADICGNMAQEIKQIQTYLNSPNEKVPTAEVDQNKSQWRVVSASTGPRNPDLMTDVQSE
ncbi:hypothetical protein L873DRAFT_1737344 [Choiromyces venosus 120613-1]|uniref:Uncharacterized protein n=1 Tax=Choiromyces venosus 120613-1 TaxID=1336337 RepID=A0A3N4JSM3_9PEZI|nr:hypothetical protein L873DRAFT_1737344 [Choiromyces venosus 120613-1]